MHLNKDCIHLTNEDYLEFYKDSSFWSMVNANVATVEVRPLSHA